MKVLLTKPFLKQTHRMIVTIPTGLLYIASYLEKYLSDVEVKIVDPDVFQGSFEAFLDDIRLFEPDIIGVSVFSCVVTQASRMIGKIKNELPEVPIIVGGSHVTAVGKQALIQLKPADYAIAGEGEKGFLEFCKQLFHKQKLVDHDAIPGLVYSKDLTIVKNNNTFTDNLDEFDPVNYRLINMSVYFQSGSPTGLFRRGSHVAQLITTRGCPFNCTFCAAGVNMGKKVRRRSTLNIVNEIEGLISLGVDEIHVMDDNFTFDRYHVIGLCREIINRELHIRFSMPNGVRLDRLDEEMLIWMKKAGWYHLGFGIEVGSDKALKIVRKGVTIHEIKAKIEMVKRIGFTTTGFFILGLPHDDVNSICETAAMPDNLGLDMASFGNFTPLPGTKIYNEIINKGEITKGFLPSFSSGEITYSPPTITPQQLARLIRNIILRYWIHPRRIKLILSRLKLRDLVYVFRRLFLICYRPKLTD